MIKKKRIDKNTKLTDAMYEVEFLQDNGDIITRVLPKKLADLL